MSNVSYPKFGKVKTIVLPVPGDDSAISLSVYKERYGIDLKDILYCDAVSGYIKFKNSKTLFLLDFSEPQESKTFTELQCGLTPIVKLETGSYDSGNSDGFLNLYEPSNTLYVAFSIDQDNDFIIDNMKIVCIEL